MSAKRDFGSFHSSNVEELVRLRDEEYQAPPLPFETSFDQDLSCEFGSEKIKKELFHLREGEFVFLNHGAFGLAFRQALQAMYQFQIYSETQPLRFYDRECMPFLVTVVRRMASLLNCKPTELVMVENCTFAFNSLLSSIDLNPGEQVFIFNTSYGAFKKILKAFCKTKAANLVEETIQFPLMSENDIKREIFDKLEKHLLSNTQTKYVFVDYIPSNHSFVMPVKEIVKICRRLREDIIVVIDAAHAIGSISRLDFHDIGADVIFANCHKWLCAPKGTAVLYRNERLDDRLTIHPCVLSHGIGAGFHSEFLWSGLKDYCAYLALHTTLDIWQKSLGGFDKAIGYCTQLATSASELLKERFGTEFLVHPKFCSTMVLVKLPKAFVQKCIESADICNFTYDQAEVVQNLLFNHHKIEVPIKAIQGDLYVRISCHVYNRLDEYKFLADVIVS